MFLRLNSQSPHNLTSHELHIWHASFADFVDSAPFAAALDTVETDSAYRFRSPVLQHNYILTRGLARLLLGHYLGIVPKSIEYSFNQYSKPEICTNNPINLQFNISHSRDALVIALAQDAVGVDIEYVQNRATDLDVIATRFFHPQEIVAFNTNLSQIQKEELFFNLWTKKEAIIKALGHGLSCPLNSFFIDWHKPTQQLSLQGNLWTLKEVAIAQGYKCAVASKNPLQIVINQLTSKITSQLMSGITRRSRQHKQHD